MKYITIGEKGGSGKSTIAYHFISSYILQKQKKGANQSKVEIYEFDAHNKTIEYMPETERIESKTITMDKDEMIEAWANIDYLSSEGKAIIVDVGGSDNTDTFLKMLSHSESGEDTVFIVPEMNKKTVSAENTIRKIKDAVPNANIILALNRWNSEKDPKREFKFFYGDSQFGIPHSPLLKEKNVYASFIPSCDIAIGLSEMFKVSLWEMASMFLAIGHMSIEEKKRIWSEEDSDGNIIPCTQEKFVEQSKKLFSSKKAYETILDAKHFFEILQTIEEQNKK